MNYLDIARKIAHSFTKRTPDLLPGPWSTKTTTSTNNNHIREPEGFESIKFLSLINAEGQLNLAKLKKLKDRVTQYRHYIFDDFDLMNPEWFERWISEPQSVFFELGDNDGIMVVNNYHKNTGNCAIIIWSRSYLGKPYMAMLALKASFDLGFRKLYAWITAHNRLSQKYIAHLPFRQVGTIKSDFLKMGHFYDVNFYEVCRKDFYIFFDQYQKDHPHRSDQKMWR